MRLNSKQILESTGGIYIVAPIDATRIARGLSWDSRDVGNDYIYVALPGQRVDGHEFVGHAIKAGAIIVLVSEKLDDEVLLFAKEMGVAVIEVSNTTSAITDVARMWRAALRGHIVGLTGSVGKTTTKNLIRDVTARAGLVCATEGNQNNELGVPKTLLSANPETKTVVVEMGMRGRGQIAELCDFVKPGIGVITNIGESHIELLGSREAIACAKAELLEALPDHQGCAVLNAADPYRDFLIRHARLFERGVKVITFDGSGQSLEPDADIFATHITQDIQGKAHFMIHTPDGEASCSLNLCGLHMVHDACAAAAVGWHLGIDIDTIAAALATSEPEPGRMDVVLAPRGFTVIDDSYNASPDSMRASLVMFASFNTPGKKYAVLGDMGELGDYAQACHEGIGEQVASLPIDRLICIGDLSRFIADSARQSGMPDEAITHADSVSEVISELENHLEQGDAVLVKASNFMGLKRIVGGLMS